MPIENRSTVELVKDVLDVVGALVEQVLHRCTAEEWQDIEDVLNELVTELRARAVPKADTGDES